MKNCKNCGHQLRKRKYRNEYYHFHSIDHGHTCLEIISKEGNEPPYKNVKYCHCDKPELESN